MIKKIFIPLATFIFLFTPFFVFVQAQTSGVINLPPMTVTANADRQLENPLGSGTNLTVLIEELLTLVAQVGSVVCVFFIIYAGFLFIKAQGNETELTKAKSILFWSVVGAAILLGATVIAQLIKGTVGSVLGSTIN